MTSRTQAPSPDRILVFRLSSIGDILLTTPLLRSLRIAYPKARITFAVKEALADLVRHNPHIDDLITCRRNEGLPGFIGEIQGRRFDWMLDIHRNYRSALVRLLARIPLVTSYSKHLWRRNLLVWFKINRLAGVKPVRLRYFEAVKGRNIGDDGNGTEFVVGAEAVEKAGKALSDAGVTTARPLIVMCPGASFTNKQWQVEGFAATARYFAGKGRYFIALLGSKADAARCDEIRLQAGTGVFSFAGAISLLETGAVISRAAVVLTHDSGLMHMAQALRKPVVALFGPTVRELGYAPFPPNATVVEKELPCRPCTHNGLNRCPKKHHRCMRDIKAEEVIEAMDRYLGPKAESRIGNRE